MSDQEAISTGREGFVTAFNRADIEALVDLVTDDTVSMPPNQPPLWERTRSVPGGGKVSTQQPRMWGFRLRN